MENKKLDEYTVMLLSLEIINTIVFGYGHYLSNSNFLKFTTVALWGVITAGLLAGFLSARADELRRERKK